ncbi:MAG: metal-dependent hydrolase [Haloarculaceae archaeon]
MPSELVHLAFAGFLAVGLLGPAFSRRSVAIVLAAAAIPDLDAVLALWVEGVHRALLHSLVAVAVLAALAAVDLRRERSLLHRAFGDEGARVVAVAVASVALAGIAPDLLTNGVNVFYPVVDRFYALDGHLLLSSTRGIVQTFVEFHGGDTVVGTTQTAFYYTGVDPTRGADPRAVERVFPVVNSGLQLLVVVTSTLVLWGRFRDQPAAEGHKR